MEDKTDAKAYDPTRCRRYLVERVSHVTSSIILVVVSLSFSIAGCRNGSSTVDKPTTTRTVPVVAFSSAQVYHALSPARDLQRIVELNRILKNPVSNIWIVKLDGSEARRLNLTAAIGSEYSYPVCSPDGSMIAFDSHRATDGDDEGNANSTSNIWVINADGSGTRPLTQLTAKGADSFGAAWSPDGKRIAYSSKRSLDKTNNANPHGTSNIWVVNADGSDAKVLTQITAEGAYSAKPVWSRDGKKIAFTSRRALDGSDNTNNISNLWIMNADGSGIEALTKLTAEGAPSDEPAWSPDGSKIAFESNRALNGSSEYSESVNIWVINADGSGVKPLTQFLARSAHSLWPNWSPDGSKIVFASSRTLNGSDSENSNELFNIWVMNADGSGAKSLTQLTVRDQPSETWIRDRERILILGTVEPSAGVASKP